MAIGKEYHEDEVVKAIAKAMEDFYGTLIEKIDGLDIVKIMKRKNPYLYRAKAMENASTMNRSSKIICTILTFALAVPGMLGAQALTAEEAYADKL